MKNQIIIRDLKLETIIGVDAWEKRLPQTLLLDVVIDMTDDKTFVSDDLSGTIDYTKIIARLKALAKTHHCQLLECFAEQAAEAILREFDAVSVTITVRKPARLPDTREIGISLTR
ncbi:MAG: dihydroneopterin aldolase [Burkholderiales bacterium]|jgi:dihydroneopterin aldolase|nr:dihydroneopterin aldolase [Burkholderiales bacterium]